jgi:hypothetical protein
MQSSASNLTAPIYNLIAGGWANEKTVARLINLNDASALRKYLDTCRANRDRELVEAEMSEHYAEQVQMCRRWLDEAYTASGEDRDTTRQRIADMKTFINDFGLTDAMRQAWIEKFRG